MPPALQRLPARNSALFLAGNVLPSRYGFLCHHYPHGAFNREQGRQAKLEVDRLRSNGSRDTEGQRRLSVNGIARILSLQAYSVTAATEEDLRLVETQHPLPLKARSFPASIEDSKSNGSLVAHGKPLEIGNSDVSAAQNPQMPFQGNSAEGLVKRREWEKQLSTFEQYQFQSNLESHLDHNGLLINNDVYARDWVLWLELIRFRRRHVDFGGVHAIYREIFRRGKYLPTKGAVGKELWDLLLHACHQDPSFLEETIVYAAGVKRITGVASSRVYGSIVGHALKKDPKSAIRWHLLLKEDFAPSVGDYKKLFGLSISWGTVASFRHLYEDFPLSGMYAFVIPELCRLQMYEEATIWHHLLSEHQDLPLDFEELKPLLSYLVQAGNDSEIDQVVRSLDQGYGEGSRIINVAAKFVRKNEAISREIMNRRLGEVHGVAPRQLSDTFCARLFATRLFTVKTVILGLQMMGLEAIGPCSLREVASRDNCLPEAILRHLSDLKEAGVPPDNSIFSILLQKLAQAGNQRLLKSLVECDLHPDTFEDFDLQEKLLAQYQETNDELQVERTLATLTIRCSSHKERAKCWWNLVLRSHITMRRPDAVKSIMERMLRAGMPITSRSSRHLRVCWLSRRQRGHRAEWTVELSILVRATQNTLMSGSFVPIIAWREIMRRLGMAGRLAEFENLALWLVHFYSSPAGRQSLPTQMLLHGEANQPGMEAIGLAKNHNPQRFLNILFTTSAQHAIVTWGFQQEVKLHPESNHTFKRLKTSSTVPAPPRTQWTWGLILLRKLQERGVPIHKATVARICKQRLNALFGRGYSHRPINRRSRWINDIRAKALKQYTASSYIRIMEGIWGRDLFRHQIQWERGLKHKSRQRARCWAHKAGSGQDFVDNPGCPKD